MLFRSLANDFTDRGINYLRFSMPTKVSEYMISGTPVLVYASGELAVSGFFSNNNCGLCVKNRDKTELVEAIEFMINNHDYRKEISNNAMRIASQNFDVIRVRSSFQNLITGLYSLRQEKD